MENAPLIYIVGSNPRPEDTEKLARWYNDRHIPMLMKYGVNSAERFKILTESADYPVYLNIYRYENMQAYQKRQSPEASAEISKDSHATWPDGYGITWRAAYFEHRKWVTPSVSQLNAGAVIHVIGANGPGAEHDTEFNQWYDNTHVPWLMKSGTILQSVRYRIIEPNKDYPTYLAVYYFENKAKFEEFSTHPERVAAVKELNEHWPNGIGTVWRVQYQMVKGWGK